MTYSKIKYEVLRDTRETIENDVRQVEFDLRYDEARSQGMDLPGAAKYAGSYIVGHELNPHDTLLDK